MLVKAGRGICDGSMRVVAWRRDDAVGEEGSTGLDGGYAAPAPATAPAPSMLAMPNLPTEFDRTINEADASVSKFKSDGGALDGGGGMMFGK